MGRANAFMIWMVLLLIILEFAGVGALLNTGLARTIGVGLGVENALEEGIDVKGTTSSGIPIWAYAFGTILAIGIGSALIVGFITKSQSENYVILPFITTTGVLFIDVAAGILLQIGGYPIWISAIIFFVFMGITISFVTTMLEWFRGNV